MCWCAVKKLLTHSPRSMCGHVGQPTNYSLQRVTHKKTILIIVWPTRRDICLLEASKPRRNDTFCVMENVGGGTEKCCYEVRFETRRCVKMRQRLTRNPILPGRVYAHKKTQSTQAWLTTVHVRSQSMTVRYMLQPTNQCNCGSGYLEDSWQTP